MRTDARVAGAVFDCDGLLVDSTALWAGAFDAAAARAGGVLGPADHAGLVGSSIETGAARIALRFGNVNEADVLAGTIHDALRAGVRHRPPVLLPGAAEVLRELGQVMPLAVASNGPSDVVSAMLEYAGLRDMFAVICTAGDVGAPKPSALVYQEACARIGIEPSAVLGFEDSVIGAHAVIAAGMPLVLVSSDPHIAESIEQDRGDGVLQVPRLDDPRIRSKAGLDADHLSDRLARP